MRSPCTQSAFGGRCRFLAVIAVLLAAATVAGTAAAQDDEEVVRDTTAKRRQALQDAAIAQEGLDVASAEAEALLDALNKAQNAVDAQQAALDEAERAENDALAVLAEAGAMIIELEADLAETQRGLREAVVESYMSFQTPTGTLGVLGTDPWQSARETALAGFAAGSRIDDIDKLRRLGEELERWRLLSVEAAAGAETHRQEAAQILDALHAALDGEATLTVAASERVERRLYEVQLLRELDARYASEIEAAERRIAEALARRRAEQAARRRAEEEARRQALAESLTPANAAFTLVAVRGIIVNSEIAAETEGLLAAMEAEGFAALDGWGYRSHQAQISLRRSHCGTSDYAVWQMPAGRCRPPTARPGRSNHERGLAIDFTYNGRIVSSRSSEVFKALQRIAPRFGFLNLPSEPWHWSVNGN